MKRVRATRSSCNWTRTSTSPAATCSTADPHIEPIVGDDIVVDLCWMVDRPLTVGSRWWFKHGTRTGHATVREVQYHLSPATLEQEVATELTLNDLGRVRLQLSEVIVADRYHVLPEGGRMILIDPADNTTAAAAMVHGLGSP